MLCCQLVQISCCIANGAEIDLRKKSNCIQVSEQVRFVSTLKHIVLSTGSDPRWERGANDEFDFSCEIIDFRVAFMSDFEQIVFILSTGSDAYKAPGLSWDTWAGFAAARCTSQPISPTSVDTRCRRTKEEETSRNISRCQPRVSDDRLWEYVNNQISVDFQCWLMDVEMWPDVTWEVQKSHHDWLLDFGEKPCRLKTNQANNDPSVCLLACLAMDRRGAPCEVRGSFRNLQRSRHPTSRFSLHR